MDDIPLWVELATLIALLVMSAFFSIAETAMMAVNRYRLRHLVAQGHRGARLAAQLLKRTDKLLGGILIGNTLVIAAATTISSLVAVHLLGEDKVAYAISTLVISFLIIIFSEITPKVVGATYPERTALSLAYLLRATMWLLEPVAWFVNLFVRPLLALLRIRPEQTVETPKLSPEEIRTLVLESSSFMPKKHVSILLNLFELEAITVDDVMVPRNHLEAIDIEAPLEQIRQQVATAHHRRLLVYRADLDEVLGTLRVRNVLNLVQNEELTREKLRELVQKPYYVPAGTPLFSQMQNFQEQKDRMSLVVDEYGELLGLVTLDDILEEIVGEFTTQSPLQSGGYTRQADGSYLVEGATQLRVLNRKLGFNFPLDGPKTLNGLILEHLQDIPAPGTSLKIAGQPMDIVQTQDRVVRAVRVSPPAAPAAAPGAAAPGAAA
jgi:magnesium and cobalt exporter, CNNM family